MEQRPWRHIPPPSCGRGHSARPPETLSVNPAPLPCLGCHPSSSLRSGPTAAEMGTWRQTELRFVAPCLTWGAEVTSKAGHMLRLPAKQDTKKIRNMLGNNLLKKIWRKVVVGKIWIALDFLTSLWFSIYLLCIGWQGKGTLKSLQLLQSLSIFIWPEI